MCVMVGALAARVQADTGWWGEGREGRVEGRRIAPAARNLVSCNAENFVRPNSPSYVHRSPTAEESYFEFRINISRCHNNVITKF